MQREWTGSETRFITTSQCLPASDLLEFLGGGHSWTWYVATQTDRPCQIARFFIPRAQGITCSDCQNSNRLTLKHRTHENDEHGTHWNDSKTKTTVDWRNAAPPGMHKKPLVNNGSTTNLNWWARFFSHPQVWRSAKCPHFATQSAHLQTNFLGSESFLAIYTRAGWTASFPLKKGGKGRRGFSCWVKR